MQFYLEIASFNKHQVSKYQSKEVSEGWINAQTFISNGKDVQF